MTTEASTQPPALVTDRAVRVPLGAELPMFCERCGYSLHGATPIRCGGCELLHFQCPECGHRQSLNTLRPAAQRVLGRLRATWIGFAVIGKLAVIFACLIGWFAVGAANCIDYSWDQRNYVATTRYSRSSYTYAPGALKLETVIGVLIFAACFGAICRLLLLRWRRGGFVGIGLGGLVVLAACIGAWTRCAGDREIKFNPIQGDFLILLLIAASMTVAASIVAWPIWVGAVRIVVPSRAGAALLAWQHSLSERKPAPSDLSAPLARE